MGALRADLQRLQRQAEVVDRARRARQVEDEVDRLVDPDPVDDVLVQEREPVVAQVLDVLERARLEVVDADHPVPLLEQVVAEMGAEEAGAAGHHRGRHAGNRTDASERPGRNCA